MNLWHQRVIIFCTKVFGVLCGLLFVGYFLYYNLYFKTDTLIKYVPKNAVLYSTIRLTPELQQNPLVAKILSQLTSLYTLPITNSDSLNQLVGNNLSIALVPQADNSKIDTLVLVDLGMRPQNINQYLQLAENYNWQSHIFSNQTKSKNILAITSSIELMEQVKNIAVKQKPALNQRIEVVFNLKKFGPQKFFGKIFLDKGSLKLFAPLINKSNNQILLNLVNNNYQQQIFAGLKSQEANIYIQNNPDKIYDKNSSSLKEIWPNNIAYSFTFTNLPAKWQSMQDSLKQTDFQYFTSLINNKEYLENLYNFKLEQDILPLIGNKAQIFVSNDNKYLLATTLTEDQVANQTGKIETIIKTYIANTYPVEKTRQLPDYTSIISIVRDIESLQFKEDEVVGLKIRSISKGDQEFTYILANNHLIFANSREIITNLLNNDLKINNWKNTGILNNLTNFSQEAWVNLNNINTEYNINKLIEYINLAEDNSTNEFRLILE